jgi:prepilin peptidase CpaA
MAVEFALFGSAVLMTAAWRDVAVRTIPDTLSVLLLAIGGLARVLEGPWELVLSAGVALLLFVFLFAAFSRGLIGGGDVKLMTAFAIGLRPVDSYRFVVATAIAGGLLGITYLLLSRMPHFVRQIRRTSLLGRVFAVEAWRIRRRRPLPYGVAIAAGGTFVLLHSGSF